VAMAGSSSASVRVPAGAGPTLKGRRLKQAPADPACKPADKFVLMTKPQVPPHCHAEQCFERATVARCEGTLMILRSVVRMSGC
jgi:hypothetical protein